MPKLKGYDIVQLINPHFFKLKPGKLIYFFKELQRQNGSVFLSLAGNDHFFVKACTYGKMFRFSEFRVGDEPTAFAIDKADFEADYLLNSINKFTTDIYERIDGAMSVLPEYDIAAKQILGDKLAFTNLPINLDELPKQPFIINDKVNILVGMRSNAIQAKGTQILLDSALELEKQMPERVNVINVRDLPWVEYKKVLASAHIVLDQLYSYSPGMNALSAMALGRIAGSGAQPEYYQYINEESRPILELSPLIPNLTDHLRDLILDTHRMEQMADQGRKLVEKHNDMAIVTNRYLNHWETILNKKH